MPNSPLYPPVSQIIPSGGDGNDLQIVDSNKALSESVLWAILENYYRQEKINAWDDVPSYATNNRLIGEVYAELVVSLLLDVLPRLNVQAPIYIVEPAAGTGCFSAHFLEALTTKLAYFERLRTLNVQYVLTDFSDTNFQTWKNQPRLRPFVESGLLHFAVFRPEEDQELELSTCGTIISQNTLKNPLMVLANYFFDSIRQDLFKVSNTVLHEARVTFFRELTPEVPQNAPLRLRHMRNFETLVPIQQPYYADARLNQLLSAYESQLQDTPFLLPIGGLNCITNLQRLSSGQLILLSSDKGITQLPEVASYLAFVSHGDGFSFYVNYHAIREYFQQEGGQSLQTENCRLITNLNVLLPGEPLPLEHTRAFFQEKLIKQNILLNHCDTLYILTQGIDPVTRCKAFLAHLRQSHYEPMALFLLGTSLMDICPGLDDLQRAQLIQVLDRIQANLFRVQHQPDLWATLGAFYYHIGESASCLKMVETSHQIYGATPLGLYYRAVSQEALGLKAQALESFRELRQVQPDCPLSQQGIQRLENQDKNEGVTEPLADFTYFHQLMQKGTSFS